jgi:hypothetical protein
LALPSKSASVVKVCAWANAVAKTAATNMIAEASAVVAIRPHVAGIQLRFCVALFIILPD